MSTCCCTLTFDTRYTSQALIEQRDARTVSLEKFRRRASKSKKQVRTRYNTKALVEKVFSLPLQPELMNQLPILHATQSTKIELKRKERHYKKDEARLDREMIHFERVKKAKMNAILKDLVTSQMVFFARGLELLSEAYANLDAIDTANPTLPPVLEKASAALKPKKAKPPRPSRPTDEALSAAGESVAMIFDGTPE